MKQMLVVAVGICVLAGCRGLATKSSQTLETRTDVVIERNPRGDQCPDWTREGNLWPSKREGYMYVLGNAVGDYEAQARLDAADMAGRDAAFRILRLVDERRYFSDSQRNSSYYVPVLAMVRDVVGGTISKIAIRDTDALDACVERRHKLISGVVQEYFNVYRLFELSKKQLPNALEAAKEELSKTQKAYEEAREAQKAELLKQSAKMLDDAKGQLFR